MRTTRSIVFSHTNLVTSDWHRLAVFYENVFGCERVLPQRRLGGKLIARGTGLPTANIQGIHLSLPGSGGSGPTLEIFQYEEVVHRCAPSANTRGIGHIAFEVPDVDEIRNVAIRHGGSALGEKVTVNVPDVGDVTFVYVRDPDGNIVELQSWKKRRSQSPRSSSIPRKRRIQSMETV